MKKNYLLVNVYSDSKRGYSFVVYTEYTENDTEEVINACLKNELFQDEEDAYNCSIVEADDSDVTAFEYCKAVYDIA